MVPHTAEWVKGGGETVAGGRVPATWNVSTGLYVAPGQGVDDNPVKTVWVTCSHMKLMPGHRKVQD